MRSFVLSLAVMTLLVGCGGNKSNSNVSTSVTNTTSNQSQAAKVPAGPKFASSYTDLNSECKNAVKDEQLTEGQDVPLKCQGFGGYYLTINYSAFGSQASVEMERDEEYSVALPMQPLGYDREKGRKIEWRTADDKPFAVIARVTEYRDDAGEDGDNPFQDKYKTGESLLVKGLKGFEHIDFTVNTKDADANSKAREMADSAYSRR